MNKRSLVSALRWSSAGLAALLLSGCTLDVLSPKGDIGMQEKSLILIATGLMLVVVIPVIAMTLYFAWRYVRAEVVALDRYRSGGVDGSVHHHRDPRDDHLAHHTPVGSIQAAGP